MKHFLAWVVCVMLAITSFAQNTDLQELLSDLAEAQTAREKMVLNYEISEAYLRTNAKEAETYGKAAYNIAIEQNNKGMAARAAYQVALAYERQRDDRNTEVWLRTALNYAKQAGDSDLIIRSVEKRSQLATKDRDYRQAYQIVQEAFAYFSQKGTSISDLEARYESQRGQIERDKRELERQRDQLEFLVRNLRNEAEQLGADKSQLEARQAELIQSNRQKETELSTKAEELASVSELREQAERRAQQRAVEVEELSEEAAKEQLLRQEKENELMASQLLIEQSQKLLYLLVGIAGIVLLLALLFFSLFRAKRRTAKQLEEKNRIIDEERNRSDELLLNILPTAIATELKASGKAKARKFEEVTVLFSDFKNFTRIAEQLPPEELVEELDKCFKAFDFILSQYDDIEKIKTIGDAYMCASGLSDRKTMPVNLVRAALEMQTFLDEQRRERERLGKPFFEARIGLHTGPVVAGVVGVKKFAYDIWGDTVNIASRVEANSQTGRVNISETTFGLIKYEFECEYRGKVDAKNKGLLDMYYVIKEKAGVLA